MGSLLPLQGFRFYRSIKVYRCAFKFNIFTVKCIYEYNEYNIEIPNSRELRYLYF